MVSNHRAATGRAWIDLEVDTDLTIVKLHPDGSRAATYAGRVVRQVRIGDENWIEVAAKWTFGPVNSAGLQFLPGDNLVEFFSPDKMFNVFQVIDPNSATRGWYANVTNPSWIENGPDGPTLFWHDLFLDVILLANGTLTVADEDELDASTLEEVYPKLAHAIRASCEELVRRANLSIYPFHLKAEGESATD